MNRFSKFFAITASFIIAPYACSDFPCDAGQVLKDNQCIDDPTEPAPEPEDDASAPDNDASAGSSGAGGTSGAAGSGGSSGAGGSSGSAGSSSTEDYWGKTCSTDDDCGADAATCGKAPGQASGTCTATGCNADPTVCVDGYTCLSFADACVAE